MNPAYFEFSTVDSNYVEPYYRASRVYNQYRSDEDTIKWYNITPTLGSEIGNAYDAISGSYSIDGNIGEQLNVIGRVIDINRSVIGSVELTVFECDDDSVECDNDEAQCSVQFISDDGALDDQYFRPLLKAKVAKNTSNATIDSIILATKIILSSDQEVRLRDSEDMTFTIEIYDGIAPIERDLLSKGIIPTPQGVRLRGVLDGIGIAECGDDEMECGNLNAECIGLIEVN
jgi:hypothetical protein